MTGRPSSFTQHGDDKPKPAPDWSTYAAFMRGAAGMEPGKPYTMEEAIRSGALKDGDE